MAAEATGPDARVASPWPFLVRSLARSRLPLLLRWLRRACWLQSPSAHRPWKARPLPLPLPLPATQLLLPATC